MEIGNGIDDGVCISLSPTESKCFHGMQGVSPTLARKAQTKYFVGFLKTYCWSTRSEDY